MRTRNILSVIAVPALFLITCLSLSHPAHAWSWKDSAKEFPKLTPKQKQEILKIQKRIDKEEKFAQETRDRLEDISKGRDEFTNQSLAYPYEEMNKIKKSGVLAGVNAKIEKWEKSDKQKPPTSFLTPQEKEAYLRMTQLSDEADKIIESRKEPLYGYLRAKEDAVRTLTDQMKELKQRFGGVEKKGAGELQGTQWRGDNYFADGTIMTRFTLGFNRGSSGSLSGQMIITITIPNYPGTTTVTQKYPILGGSIQGDMIQFRVGTAEGFPAPTNNSQNWYVGRFINKNQVEGHAEFRIPGRSAEKISKFKMIR